jgi:hypothetical protein
VLSKLLEKQYEVKVYRNKYDYKEMAFKDEGFKDTFFAVMEYLRKKRIYVSVLDILVQNGPNPKTAEYERYKNWKHTPYSRIDYFEAEGKE